MPSGVECRTGRTRSTASDALYRQRENKYQFYVTKKIGIVWWLFAHNVVFRLNMDMGCGCGYGLWLWLWLWVMGYGLVVDMGCGLVDG